jgi:NAD(P)-dependent dehydrogenase (short-subunit alcohol dehydrogenase family)
MTAQKIAAITGGNTGIGAASVAALQAQGVRCFSIGLPDKEASNAEAPDLEFINCDVSDGEQVNRAFAEIRNRAGRLDYLVNSAGTLSYGNVLELSEAEWDRVLGVNTKGPFLCAKAAIPLMDSGGVIINVSSVQAFITQPQVAAYCTSKTALLGLTRSIATDFAPDIRCIAVCPGTVDTPMLQGALAQAADPDAMMSELNAAHLTGRVGTAMEIGELIAFLCSDKCGFITGQAMRVDGGLGVNMGGSKN